MGKVIEAICFMLVGAWAMYGITDVIEYGFH